MAVQQLGDSGQVLSDMPVLPGFGSRCSQYRVTGVGRSF
jgi:hypothetical protein